MPDFKEERDKEAAFPAEGVTVEKYALDEKRYICVITVKEREHTYTGQLSLDEYEILRGSGDAPVFPPELLRSMVCRWPLCRDSQEISEEKVCSYWVYQDIYE